MAFASTRTARFKPICGFWIWRARPGQVRFFGRSRRTAARSSVGSSVRGSKGQRDVRHVPNMQHLQSDEQLQAWLGILRARRWVADSQITPKHLVGRDSATRYFACYVTGSAISNSRIRADDGRNVTIDVWGYRTDRWTTETMPGEEFVRRFLLHIIPPYVHRVRYAGCFQSGKRKSRLAGIRAAILDQKRQQAIASPRAEHKAKLLAIGIEQTDEAVLVQREMDFCLIDVNRKWVTVTNLF